MIKPFQIVIELLEFGLQALFVYILALILVIGFLVWSISSLHTQRIEHIDSNPKPHIYSKARIEQVKECTRLDGCRIRKDGTIEY